MDYKGYKIYAIYHAHTVRFVILEDACRRQYVSLADAKSRIDKWLDYDAKFMEVAANV